MRILLVFLLAFLLYAPAGAETDAYDAIAASGQDIQLDGTLTVLHEDYFDKGVGVYRHFLETSKGKVELHFKKMPTKFLTGQKVKVRGKKLGSHVAVQADGMTLEVLPATSIVPNTFGEQKTLVIITNFTDAVSTDTIPDVTAQMFGATNSVSSWDREKSYGQTWLSGIVVGPYTVNFSQSQCASSYYSIASAALNAATAAGITVSNYKRYVFDLANASCGWSGLGTVGGSPSYAWLRGGLGSSHPSVATHEMGHNLGLYHSHSLDCPYVTGWPPISPTGCNTNEYGDALDVMGLQASWGPFNANQKERLGWLGYGSLPTITTVSTSGTYSIIAYESAGTAPRALKVPTTNGFFYYVHLQPGYLATLGVLIHYANPVDPTTSYLLNMNGGKYRDWSLDVGQTFVDPYTGLSIYAKSADGNAATVVVAFSGGVLPPPVLSLTAS